MNGTTRKPWVAVLLSVFCGGLGHVYCGRLARGFAVLLVGLLPSVAVLALVVLPPSDGMLWALLAAYAVSALVYVLAIFDALRIARRIPADATLRAYQRPLVYVLFVATSILVPLLGAVVVRAGFLEAFKIPTGSMDPTICAGSRILVNKARLSRRAIERGDIVVYRGEPDGRWYVKRVVGLPGDRVEGGDGMIQVNGEVLPAAREPGAADEIRRERTLGRSWLVRPGTGFRKTTVPEGSYFLLGDNRDASKGSRYVGCIPAAAIGGVAEYVFIAGGVSRIGALGRDR